jgi:tetratricopeptide (TPR) repeat protein
VIAGYDRSMERRRIQRFEVIGHLGTGGMGSVFHARDPQLERDVAIKVLADPSEAATNALATHETLDLRRSGPASAGDLLREARMMARLSHHNVMPVYEVGLAEDGAVFVVMEHIDGSDLRTWLAGERTVPEILAVFAQAGRGLAAAHARGIVHRDFKPDNVLIGGDGRVCVADFGLSRLATKPSALVRIDDGGTPRYMAPELWRGTPASAASDVFAFCTAATEALAGQLGDGADKRMRDRGVPPRVRAMLALGVAVDPAARPSLDAAIAAFEGRAPARRWWLAGAAAAAAIAITVALALPSHARDCGDDPARFAGRWDASMRMGVVRALAVRYKAPTILGLVASLDDQRGAIDHELRATCRAADDELTTAQARQRRACLERRILEIGATAAALTTSTAEIADLRTRVEGIPPAAECVEIASTPADSTRAAALIGEFARSFDAVRDDRPALLGQIERDANAAGETELAARAALWLGIRLRGIDQIAAGDEAFVRAYQGAREARSSTLEATALVERSIAAEIRGDQAASKSYAETARVIADRPGAQARMRGRVYWVLGRAARERGDRGARELLQRGLDIIAADGHRLPGIEVPLRVDLMRVLIEIEDRPTAGVALARETADYARLAFGDDATDSAVAINMLAFALRSNNELEAAIPYRRTALAIMVAKLPADSAQVLRERADYADDLAAIGDYVHAREELANAVEQSRHNEALGGNRPTLLGDLASATFELGEHDEALRLYAESIDEFTMQNGRDNPLTLEYRRSMADRQLEAGKLDDAERSIASLEVGYAAHPEPNDKRIAILSGVYKAQLALARGKPRDAEPLTRAALATWDELHGDDVNREDLLRTLAWSLIDQRRFAEARVVLDKALAISRARNARADGVAQLEIKLARIEAGQGQRADALARARRARAALERFPGTIVSRKEADALIAELSR